MKFFAGLLLGITLMSLFMKFAPAPVSEEARQEFRTFSDAEARKYAEASTPEAKLKAAEELYGKMMILFLANLGMKLQENRPVDLLEEAKFPDPVKEKEACATALPQKLECAPCNCPSAQTAKAAPEKKTTPGETFRRSPYLSSMTPVLRNMRGQFHGKLSHFAGSRKGKVDQVLIDVNLSQKERQLYGGIGVILTDEESNTPYSRSQGNGGNKSIRFDEASQTVFVEASPNSFFAFRAREFARNEVNGEYFVDSVLVGKALLYRQ